MESFWGGGGDREWGREAFKRHKQGKDVNKERLDYKIWGLWQKAYQNSEQLNLLFTDDITNQRFIGVVGVVID